MSTLPLLMGTLAKISFFVIYPITPPTIKVYICYKINTKLIRSAYHIDYVNLT